MLYVMLIWVGCVRDHFIQNTEKSSEDTAVPEDTAQDSGMTEQIPAEENTPPEILSLTLSHNVLYTNDVLVVQVDVFDAEEDPVELRYDWYVNEQVVQSGEDAYLDGSEFFDRGDEVYVIAIPNDGIDLGVPEQSTRLVVENTLPSTPILSIVNSCLLYTSDAADE